MRSHARILTFYFTRLQSPENTDSCTLGYLDSPVGRWMLRVAAFYDEFIHNIGCFTMFYQFCC